MSNKEGLAIKGMPYSFILRNTGIRILNLDIAI